MKAPHTSLLSLLILFSTPIFATTEVDPAFRTEISGTVHAIALTSDGQIVVGGEFSHVNGAAYLNIARLHSDGSFDDEFSLAVDGAVLCLTAVADGSIYAGGAFNTPTSHLLRLKPDGLPDFGIAASGGTASRITCLAEDQQNGVYVGGPFTRVGGSAGYYVAKFDSSGGIDKAFSSPLARSFSMEAGVNAVVVQSDGKILLAGNFSAGTEFASLIRLNANGSIDGTFCGDHGPMLYPNSMLLQSDGKLLVAGTLNSAGEGFVRRLHPDASIDDSFKAEAFGASVETIALDSAGRILVGGNFEGKLARLNPDGSKDESWTIDADGAVRSIQLQPDGAIMVGGAFTRIGGYPRSGIARLRPTHSFQASATNENGQFRARLQGKKGRIYAIEFSDDLQSWTAGGTTTASQLGIEINDETVTRKQRFFRARLVD